MAHPVKEVDVVPNTTLGTDMFQEGQGFRVLEPEECLKFINLDSEVRPVGF